MYITIYIIFMKLIINVNSKLCISMYHWADGKNLLLVRWCTINIVEETRKSIMRRQNNKLRRIQKKAGKNILTTDIRTGQITINCAYKNTWRMVEENFRNVWSYQNEIVTLLIYQNSFMSCY